MSERMPAEPGRRRVPSALGHRNWGCTAARMAGFGSRTLYLPQPSAAVGRSARNERVPDYDMMRPLPLAACLALAAALSVAVVTAQTPAPQEAAPAAAAPAQPAAPAAAQQLVGNAATGRTLAYTCQGCHGVTGYKNAYPSFHVPRIGGQSAEYLTQALTEYKKGNRKHPTMQAQAQSFSDQDIADISAYLSSVK